MIADPNGRLLPINTWRQFVWGAVLSAAGRENPLCVQILLICPIHPLGCSMILPMMTIWEWWQWWWWLWLWLWLWLWWLQYDGDGMRMRACLSLGRSLCGSCPAFTSNFTLRSEHSLGGDAHEQPFISSTWDGDEHEDAREDAHKTATVQPFIFYEWKWGGKIFEAIFKKNCFSFYFYYSANISILINTAS